jgi:hypothetical protein
MENSRAAEAALLFFIPIGRYVKKQRTPCNFCGGYAVLFREPLKTGLKRENG